MAIKEPPPKKSPETQPEEFDGGKPMTILEHLQELRSRLIWCVVGLVVATGISLYFTNTFMDVLVKPFNDEAPAGAHLIVTDPLENFTMFFKVGLYGGLAIGMPIFVYETLMFVLPGLTRAERRWVLPIVFGIFLSFGLGVAFAYFMVMPRTAAFLLNFNTDVAIPQIKLDRWISFSTRLIFWVGVTFETPLFILALARFGILSGRQLLRWWRYMIVLVFLVAAIVTPTPDPLTQTLVAAPLLVLYAVGVALAFLFGRPRRA